CMVCRNHADKDSMVRVVKTENGICVDRNQKQNTRGAYICLDEKCISTFEKNRVLNRCFKQDVSAEVYAQVKRELEFAKSNKQN
ncbi:MAG: YlxR family protein, partial [Clostridia bacterium]|nr:YlxR family protein [Clostridia bacterium]